MYWLNKINLQHQILHTFSNLANTQTTILCLKTTLTMSLVCTAQHSIGPAVDEKCGCVNSNGCGLRFLQLKFFSWNSCRRALARSRLKSARRTRHKYQRSDNTIREDGLDLVRRGMLTADVKLPICKFLVKDTKIRSYPHTAVPPFVRLRTHAHSPLVNPMSFGLEMYRVPFARSANVSNTLSLSHN